MSKDNRYQGFFHNIIMVEGEFAESYDKMLEDFQCFGDDAVFGLLHPYILPGQEILDIGIGTGLGSCRFKQLGVEIDGMDISSEMLYQCKKKGFTRDLKIHDMTVLPYPYEERSYDQVISVGTLHFFKDLRSILREAGRILKSGGKFTFTVMSDRDGGPEDGPEMHHTRWGRDVVHHGRNYAEKILEEEGFRKLKWLLFVGSIDPEDGKKSYYWAFIAEKA
jgi:ubiquinone/menaquinone biosynthesis C-methylase UbiE